MGWREQVGLRLEPKREVRQGRGAPFLVGEMGGWNMGCKERTSSRMVMLGIGVIAPCPDSVL